MHRAAVLALIMIALAGCASPPDPESAPTPTGAPVIGTAQVDPSGLVAAAFPGLPQSDITQYFNGTLHAQQANTAPGVPFSIQPFENSLVQVDVGKMVPKNAPVIVVVDFQAAMEHGDVQIWMTIPNGQGRNGAGNFEGGGMKHIERGLVRTTDDPILVNVFYNQAEPVAELPYVLSVRVATDPTIARAAFPIGIAVPADVKSIDVQLVGEKRAWGSESDTLNLMLWAPDDSFLGHYTLAGARTTIALPADQGAGEYVAILQQGGRSMRILTAGPQPAVLRATPQEFVFSEPIAGTTPTKGEWTTKYDRVPVLAGVWFGSSSVAAGFHVKLDGPGGNLFEGAAPAGPDALFLNVETPAGIGFTSGFEWDSSYGVPGLAAGDYHALVEFEQGADPNNLQVGDIQAFWAR